MSVVPTIQNMTGDAARKAMENFGIDGSIGRITKHLELVEVI